MPGVHSVLPKASLGSWGVQNGAQLFSREVTLRCCDPAGSAPVGTAALGCPVRQVLRLTFECARIKVSTALPAGISRSSSTRYWRGAFAQNLCRSDVPLFSSKPFRRLKHGILPSDFPQEPPGGRCRALCP